MLNINTVKKRRHSLKASGEVGLQVNTVCLATKVQDKITIY